MKWFGGIISALILLTLSTFLVAWLQPWTKTFAEEPPIKATVDLSKWIERPTKVGVERDDDESLEIRKSRHAIFMEPIQTKFMTIDLLNDSASTVKNARIVFNDHQMNDVLVVTRDGLTRKFIKGTADFTLPEFMPGDKVRLYVWSEWSFDAVLTPLALKTYSSSGPFAVTYTKPDSKEYYELEGEVDNFVLIGFRGSALYL